MEIATILILTLVCCAMPFAIEAQTGPTHPKSYYRKNYQKLLGWKKAFLRNYIRIRLFVSVILAIAIVFLHYSVNSGLEFGIILSSAFLFLATILLAAVMFWPLWIEVGGNTSD